MKRKKKHRIKRKIRKLKRHHKVKRHPKVKHIRRPKHAKLRYAIRAISVYDMMTADVIVIDSQNSMETLANILRERDVAGMPVVEHDQLVGIVSRKDVFKLTGINDLNNLTDEMLEKLRAIKVRDVMRKPITIYYRSSIRKASNMMKKYDINRLIVVDRNKKMVGIISKSDLVKGASKAIVKRRMETAIDEVLDLLKSKGALSFDEISKKFHVDKNIVEEWAKILEEHKLVVINYPVIGKPTISIVKASE